MHSDDEPLKIKDVMESGVKGHIDPDYKEPELTPEAKLLLRVDSLEYAVQLQAQYIEYIRGFIEQAITPCLPKPIAPHDMEVWVAIKMAGGDKEKLKEAVEAIKKRREEDAKVNTPRIVRLN